MLLNRALPNRALPNRTVLRAQFRDWRRRRPFWAGLLLVLAGAELIAVPLSPLAVLVSLGLGGLAALGIGSALILAGVFLWAAPRAHSYVSLNALILSVLSFAATNLGGFLVGMLLGIAGSSLGFGWTPQEEPPREETPPDTHGGGDRSRGRVMGGAAALAACLLAAGMAANTSQARALTPRQEGGAPPPPAGSVPPVVTTTRFAPYGFTVAGVRELPTANGPLKVMVLHMSAASLSDYRLVTPDPEHHARLVLGARSLGLNGQVTLYLSRFSGCIEGIRALCLTFTPDRLPVPPLVPPFVFLTRVTAEQALVTSDTIDAAGLTLDAGP